MHLIFTGCAVLPALCHKPSLVNKTVYERIQMCVCVYLRMCVYVWVNQFVCMCVCLSACMCERSEEAQCYLTEKAKFKICLRLPVFTKHLCLWEKYKSNPPIFPTTSVHPHTTRYLDNITLLEYQDDWRSRVSVIKCLDKTTLPLADLPSRLQ